MSVTLNSFCCVSSSLRSSSVLIICLNVKLIGACLWLWRLVWIISSLYTCFTKKQENQTLSVKNLNEFNTFCQETSGDPLYSVSHLLCIVSWERDQKGGWSGNERDFLLIAFHDTITKDSINTLRTYSICVYLSLKECSLIKEPALISLINGCGLKLTKKQQKNSTINISPPFLLMDDRHQSRSLISCWVTVTITKEPKLWGAREVRRAER